jgi:hypothetical protein
MTTTVPTTLRLVTNNVRKHIGTVVSIMSTSFANRFKIRPENIDKLLKFLVISVSGKSEYYEAQIHIIEKKFYLPKGVVSKKLILEDIMLVSIVLCKFVEARRVDMEIMAVANIIQIDWNIPSTPYTVKYLFL